MKIKLKTVRRWPYLTVGGMAMFFCGIIYAWSILKAPFSVQFGWTASELSLNFTFTLCFFCLGGITASFICKRIGLRLTLFITSGLTAAGFGLTSLLTGNSTVALYICYGVIAGTGIGIAYNVIISTVSSWFPDKTGFCIGILMMCFGCSSLVLGNFADRLIRTESFGWRKTFFCLAVCLLITLALTGIVLRKPGTGDHLPDTKPRNAEKKSIYMQHHFTPFEMMRTKSFWQVFFYIAFLSSVGNCFINITRDLAFEVGLSAVFATLLVGILSVFNGLGRIVFGALIDLILPKKVMILANIMTMCGIGLILSAISTANAGLFVTGICIIGFTYGSSPTITASLTVDFYGAEHYPANFSIFTCSLIVSSCIVMICSLFQAMTSRYFVPCIFLLILTVIAFILNMQVKKP